MTWFYDPLATYEDNLEHGPFGAFASVPPIAHDTRRDHQFLGHPVNRPFGIPAGPLVNGTFCAAAFEHGFDLPIYKTVRTSLRRPHRFPHTLAVRVDGDLPARSTEPVLADSRLSTATSISNSFGVPSRDPDEWQPDMARAVASAGPGQVLIGSFQGTRVTATAADPDESYIADWVAAARLVIETGAPILEMNLSCPNEGTGNLLCFDVPLAARIAAAVKEAVGDTPLILKIAYMDDHDLERLVSATAGIVQAYAAINTLPARLVNKRGTPALPGPGREVAGVCGAAIAWAAREMVTRLARNRDDAGAEYSIIGVGGVMNVGDAHTLAGLGADAVMSATGAMIDPLLGARVQLEPWPQRR
ncbi:tRNA-dihydrouridine synthase [Demequina sediminicola]|uniref:tRNA-dihydrouridine synthase n=1 Tax=Demequina sediminicola TaxID=1095026 RepID=UPI000784268A|nr:tRNA-dihydrouridine synthase [Demequina sediminicola]